MPLLFSFRYRRGLYLTIVILASVFLVSGIIFGALASLLLFSIDKAMPGAGIRSFSLPFILAFFMTAVIEIFAIVHAGRKLSKKCFVLAGTEWGLTVRGAFLKSIALLGISWKVSFTGRLGAELLMGSLLFDWGSGAIGETTYMSSLIMASPFE